MFLSTQDEKIGNLEDPLAFTEEDFLRPKFARIVTIIAATVVVVGKRTTNGRSRP